jgi:hypothetical protein
MLLVEDDARDVELTLDALEESNLANEVDVARDGKRLWTTFTIGDASPTALGKLRQLSYST